MSDANIATVPAGSGLPALAGANPLDNARLKLTGFMKQPAVAKALPMIGVVGVTALSGLAWLALREPPQRDLFRSLPEADKAAVAEVLDKGNIPYHLDKDTGAITVSEDEYFDAKMKLAAEGLPKSAPDGASMIDSMPMGASRAVEGEKLRSAREVDLARTIEQIDSVVKARVHLAVEPPSIFLREQTKPSASVMLQLASGRSLSKEQVDAIVHLVSSSIPNMTPETVSVVDQNGRLLSNDGQDNAEDKQIEVQNKIEERYRQAVTALLTPILGAGKFSAEVHAEVNFAERQATREIYPQDEARLRTEQGSWNSDAAGSGGQVGGVPGAIAATPPPTPTAPGTPPPSAAQLAAAQGTAAGATDAAGPAGAPQMPPYKTNETFNRQFELGREVSVTRDAVGTVRRLSVAVALDSGPDGKPRSAQEVTALEALVKGAVGFDQARGDVVALSARKFAAVDDSASVVPWYEQSWVSMAVRNVSALLVTLVLLLGIGRPLLKRWSAAKAEAAAAEAAAKEQLGQQITAAIEEQQQVAARDPEAPVTLDMISATHDYQDRAALIRDFVKQDPDRAALVVRDLLREGKSNDG
ncbi:MAG: flagellar basal-body MS-ring/collar protein FliF [Sphingobium sp.]